MNKLNLTKLYYISSSMLTLPQLNFNTISTQPQLYLNLKLTPTTN